jgi:hypothetical protein
LWCRRAEVGQAGPAHVSCLRGRRGSGVQDAPKARRAQRDAQHPGGLRGGPISFAGITTPAAAQPPPPSRSLGMMPPARAIHSRPAVTDTPARATASSCDTPSNRALRNTRTCSRGNRRPPITTPTSVRMLRALLESAGPTNVGDVEFTTSASNAQAMRKVSKSKWVYPLSVRLLTGHDQSRPGQWNGPAVASCNKVTSARFEG